MAEGVGLTAPLYAGRLHASGRWFVALEAALFLLALIAALNLASVAVASANYVGALIIVAGVTQVAHASRVWTWDALARGVVSGNLCALVGVFIFPDLLLASSVLTFPITAALLVAGMLRAVVALRERPRQGWAEVLAAGVLGALVGLVLLLGWPVTSLWVLGLILAVDLIVQGAIWPAFGLALGPRVASGRT